MIPLPTYDTQESPRQVRYLLYDERSSSPSRGTLMKIFLGQDNCSLVMIPPEVWDGFKGMSEPFAILNCCTHHHDPSRSKRIDPFKNHIPYDWDIKQE